MRGKRNRQTEELRREARRTLGQTPRTTDLTAQPSSGFDPRVAEKEEQRLSAKHDPAASTACRLCGIAVPPDPDRYVEVSGWKTCMECNELLSGGLAAVVSDVVGVTVAPAEVDEVVERVSLGNPSRYVTGWPNENGASTRWAHVDIARAVAAAPAVLGEIRTRGTPRVNSYGSGCGWCGVRMSPRWTESPFRFGRGPNAPRAALCAECEPWAARAGVHDGSTAPESWRPYLLAACVGMRKPQWDYTLGLKAYVESGLDPRGTAEPWAYLGGTRSKLRMTVAREHPRLITLTPTETRVMNLQRAAEVQPAVASRLADID
ncbi:MAG: hypothetical protein EHM24_24470 [Acidobacteria bacterium]|jgi:hypothetical protein|nr:MAG: hypothetical protein EHM24_24470 [Acidobacteriota bacterium]